MCKSILRILVFSFFVSIEAFSAEVMLKDLVNVKGVRDNQLIGTGLVVGLQNTGDTIITRKLSQKFLEKLITRLGVNVDDFISDGAIAAVAVTATLPPFAKIGDKIDLKVSTLGDATSLEGGTLILTSMLAGDDQVYAVGQGPVVTGQVTGNASSVLTVGTVPGGGTIEREYNPDYTVDGILTLSLRRADFSNASKIVDVINENYRGFFASSLTPGSVEVKIPPLYLPKPVEFIAGLERLKINAEQKAVVVVNERTGTVVMGNTVVVHPVAIAHGELSISVENEDEEEIQTKLGKLQGTTVGDLIESLNLMGAGPQDLVGILKALHRAGALQAELQFM